MPKREGRPARRAVRRGRPPRHLVAEVDARILDAAHDVFLERGLAGASIDEIASRARAGKPTLYARYPGKEALFAAVVTRNVATHVARFQSHMPAGASAQERLTEVGVALLRWILVAETVGLHRMAISEAGRFPILASSVYRMVRERGTEAVAHTLREVAQTGELVAMPAFAPEHLTATTRRFLELLIAPIVMRALYGERLTSLRAEIGPHVARGVRIFLSACRHGGVE
jgi:AcrR family transcriptional regulator